MADQVRELHLLVPDVAGAHVLVTAGGALPAGTITLADDETTVVGAIRELRGALGLDVPVLEIHFDYALAHDDVGAVPVPVLVVAEPPAADWSPPDGLAWRRLPSGECRAP